MIASAIRSSQILSRCHLARTSLASFNRTQSTDKTDNNHPGHTDGFCNVCHGTKVDSEYYTEPWIPPYPKRPAETIEVKRSRLLYQSRKRGMLENDLLLATFASRYLPKLELPQLQQYDNLINGESNDWEIFYWIIGQKPTPVEFDNDIMKLLREHAANLNKEVRIRQPDL